MTENAQNADFRRKPQIFADSPLLLEIPAFGGRRFSQKTADFRRKPKTFAENRRKPQIVLRHLRCVTFSSALRNPPIKSSSACKFLFSEWTSSRVRGYRLSWRFGGGARVVLRTEMSMLLGNEHSTIDQNTVLARSPQHCING